VSRRASARSCAPDDFVYSGHRAHGHTIALGAPPDAVMAELMGKEDGLCGGLGGSMHLVDVAHGLMGATGVIGGNVPQAAGSALAARRAGTDRVAVTFFGDGAVQAGVFIETVNLATLWRLPLIFVCENNGFAEFTPRSAHTTVERVTDVVDPYPIESATVDGNDVEEVWTVFGGYLAAARDGGGPFLLECLTYRLGGHYIGDPAKYRDALADDEWRSRDPIRRLQERAAVRGWFDEGEAEVVRQRAEAAVEEAVGSVRRSPFPAATRIAERVYAPAEPRAANLPELPAEVTYVQAIRETLGQAMRDDPSVIVVGEDVAEGGPYTSTAGLAGEFGVGRVLNTPISEAAISGLAVGAAQSGLVPVLEIMFVDFITLALDQLVNGAAKAHFMSGGQLRVPMVVRTQQGAGQRGGAQHSQSLESWLTHVPGLKVVLPNRAADVPGLLLSSINDPNPVVFIESKTLYFKREQLAQPLEHIELGRARTARAGKDVTIVAVSLLAEALAAAERLAREGIEAEVIDPRTLVPLDLETIVESVRRTSRLVVVHEAVEHGGFGAEIAAQVLAAAFWSLDAPIVRVGAPFAPVPFSPALEDAFLPGVEDIYAAVQTTLA
jgi:pyruvate/2-oxoglutarate/acetoin dehydrogenase E1 component/TPP-dependent pyruvate/acetoin dehydrogenase alpha subunit